MIKHTPVAAAFATSGLIASGQLFAQAGFAPPPPKVSPAAGVIDMHVRTPAGVVRQMNNDIAALIRTKEVADAFAAQGTEPFITTPEAFNQMLKRDIEKWAVAVTESGAKLD
jgi:hypothetical protein